jgi:elongation factor Ts
MECKRALEETDRDIDAAVKLLRERGIAKGMAVASKKADAEFNQGVVESYIHTGGRIGVLLELNCQTDFVSRTDEFRSLAHDIAMQVAAMNPSYVGLEDLPEDLDGKLGDVSLLHQPFIRDQSRTIQELVAEAIGKFGENIRIRRFSRFELGN